MIESITFEALAPGPTMVFFGRIHGNEPCGTVGINRVIEELRNGSLLLQKGRVVFVPVCNPRAAAQNVRFTERNLNRSFYPKDVKTAYEDHLDPLLCALLDDADYFVDLHSLTAGGATYVFVQGPVKADIDFASQLGLPVMVYGFGEAYSASGFVDDPMEKQGTAEYARLNGKCLSVLVECGQHDDPESGNVAYRSIRNALAAAGMTSGETMSGENVKLCRITKAVFKARDGQFTKAWQNMEPVKAGEVIAVYDDGEEVKAPHDGVILLIKHWAKPGGEWFNIAAPENL